MRIYVASSWRNDRQPEIVQRLRAAGHEVYDFHNPGTGHDGFRWSEIDPAWKDWDAQSFVKAVHHPIAERGFAFDFAAMKWADACLMVQPCGRSAALELGWCVGAGKLGVALLADGQEPELMLKIAHKLCTSMEQVLRLLGCAHREFTACHHAECVTWDVAALSARGAR